MFPSLSAEQRINSFPHRFIHLDERRPGADASTAVPDLALKISKRLAK
jgi:hypothetical protein